MDASRRRRQAPRCPADPRWITAPLYPRSHREQPPLALPMAPCDAPRWRRAQRVDVYLRLRAIWIHLARAIPLVLGPFFGGRCGGLLWGRASPRPTRPKGYGAELSGATACALALILFLAGGWMIGLLTTSGPVIADAQGYLTGRQSSPLFRSGAYCWTAFSSAQRVLARCAQLCSLASWSILPPGGCSDPGATPVCGPHCFVLYIARGVSLTLFLPHLVRCADG